MYTYKNMTVIHISEPHVHWLLGLTDQEHIVSRNFRANTYVQEIASYNIIGVEPSDIAGALKARFGRGYELLIGHLTVEMNLRRIWVLWPLKSL